MEFDVAKHQYSIDGRHISNVTSILKPISPYRNFDATKMETARQKGIAIHKMIELSSKGKLQSVPDWMVPARDEWFRFVAASQFEIEESELRVYNKTYDYAGQLDLKGSIVIARGRKQNRIRTYIDIKRSLLGGSTIGYQIAAYEQADRSMQKKIPTGLTRRFALVIREDKGFKLQEYTDPLDFDRFLTCLKWQRLQEKHNI